MIPFRKNDLQCVTDAEMMEIYEKIKTPVKHGAVIKWENDFTDSPTVFQKDGVFYMYFIAISKDTKVSGYETHLASSTDLLHWNYLGPIFRRNDLNHWDSKQCAGYAAFKDIAFDGTNALEPVNDRYYITYLAGNSDGYEPDPLFMGQAFTADPTNPDAFTRFDEPILRPDDDDARDMETKTLYKSCLFRDVLGVTGYPYVNIYNGKSQNHTERIFLAVSEDGEHWERYGDRAVLDMTLIDPGTRIAGDPALYELDFAWGGDGRAYTFRLQRNPENPDISGMYYEWTVSEIHEDPDFEIYLSADGQGICLWWDEFAAYCVAMTESADRDSLANMRELMISAYEYAE